jgi:hypothetical protein
MADFFEELKRRHIYRIAAAYAVVAWLLIQLYNNLTPMLKVPDWTGTLVLVLLIGGFPVALIFAWILELNASPVGEGVALNSAAAKLRGQDKSGEAVVPIQINRAHAEAGEPDAPIDAPDGPSLVVLPFANMSGDPGQDYFADGLTEDIITELSRFHHLFIISRNSAFRYKGKAVGVRQVARELNVEYDRR